MPELRSQVNALLIAIWDDKACIKLYCVIIYNSDADYVGYARHTQGGASVFFLFPVYKVY